MQRLLLSIVLLTFETLPACTEETPARGPTGAAGPVTEGTTETGAMTTQTTVATLMPTAAVPTPDRINAGSPLRTQSPPQVATENPTETTSTGDQSPGF